jgi:hypothetical protein
MCPAGQGHQGQDIRAADCRNSVHNAVAVTDGTITSIGSYSVYLTAADGTRYDYLHMSDVAVRVGQAVRRGQLVGRVSNQFGGASTTVHLHFNIRQSVSGVGSVFVPPYMSLVRAYEALVAPPVAPTPRFRGEFVRQSFPLASASFEMTPGQILSGSIDLRNTGTETWRPGQTFLGTTQPRDRASVLAGPGWPNDHRAASVAGDVPPGMVGSFVFTVRAPGTPGEYRQFFSLVEDGVTWFGDDGGPPDDQLQIRVTVVPGAQASDAGSETMPLDAGDVPPDPDASTDRSLSAAGCGCRAAGGRAAFGGPGVTLVALALLVARRARASRGSRARPLTS